MGGCGGGVNAMELVGLLQTAAKKPVRALSKKRKPSAVNSRATRCFRHAETGEKGVLARLVKW